MASNLRVDTIFPSSGTNVAIGTASGSVTFVGDTDISTNGDVTIGGNLGVGGTLTYEDVTNIDSVGVITARSGIDASSNLLLKTGGTERVRIASDGDVGIGTNAPVERVHIHKPSATGPFLYITNSSTGVSASDGIQIGFDGSNDVVLKNNEPTNLKFYTSASEKLRISSGGALTSTASNNGQIIHKFKNTDTTASSSAMTLEHWFNFNRSGGGMDLSAARIVAGKEREWVGGAANQDGFLAFYTALNESPTEKVRIDSSGRLLVGQTSGSSPLCVSGTDPVVAELHHSDGGTNDQSRISLGALASNPPSQRGVNLIAENNGAGHDFVVACSASHSAGPGEKVRITSGGNFGINTTSPSDKLHVNGGDIIISTASAPNLRLVKADNSTGGNTTRAFFGIATGSNNYMNGSADPDLCIVGPEGGSMMFGFGNSIKFRISTTGVLYNQATYSNTTGNSANVSVPNSDGQFYRSTSSRKYKDNITTLTDALADKILDCRPVSYTSTCNADDKTKIFYGMIAEEVHEVDTSLVLYDNEPETPEPEGVQYDRFVPALINLVKRQKAQIETLETRIAALEDS